MKTTLSPSRRRFFRALGMAAAGTLAAACAPHSPQPGVFYVSPRGDDAWSGQHPEPVASGGDGPFATLARAQAAARALGGTAGPVTVYVRGGRYFLSQPLRFGLQDAAPAAYVAYPGEAPILDGGARIPPDAWRVETLDGRRTWAADLPEAAAGRWHFKQLWVNGERRPRARLPKVGPEPERRAFFQVAGPSSGQGYFDSADRFQAPPGALSADWRNLQDVEIVLLHFWIEDRLPVAAYDPDTGVVVSSRRSAMTIKQLNPFYVENVFEALSEPGEWYLDRAAGRLYYLPLPGETPERAEVYAPRLEQLLLVEGVPASEAYVEGLRFQGLTFEHTEWSRSIDGTGAHSVQAASTAPAVVRLMGARRCAIEGCTVRHTGFYAVELAAGCLDNVVAGNHLHDLGAGGVKMSGAPSLAGPAYLTGRNRIVDNHIHAAGRVFHSGVGILSQHAYNNDLSRNHIHDLFYTGISCGWVWGYGENVSHNNRIEGNHIHDLGHGWLSDMGGIYTLGRQPGTMLRGNWIHDVERASYGGWGIYLDEGSSEILVENNLCHDLSSQAFHQHYGRENVVRNNIFAFGREGQVALSRAEGHLSFTLERNLCVSDKAVIFMGGYAASTVSGAIASDYNLFWSISGAPVRMTTFTGFDRWRSPEHDQHSIEADPLFRDAEARDFALAPDSPAIGLGFRPFELPRV